jgi:hypothetical protein
VSAVGNGVFRASLHGLMPRNCSAPRKFNYSERLVRGYRKDMPHARRLHIYQAPLSLLRNTKYTAPSRHRPAHR